MDQTQATLRLQAIVEIVAMALLDFLHFRVVLLFSGETRKRGLNHGKTRPSEAKMRRNPKLKSLN